MNFTELLQEVYNITDRSDLETLTKSAIKAATLKAHKSDFYSNDLYETGVDFGAASYTQSLDIITFIPNYLKLKYARLASENASADSSSPFFDIIEPEEVLDEYGHNRANVVYAAGRTLEFRGASDFQKILLGCYVSPIVTENGYSSWVAEQYPYAIIHEAARRVFMVIGQKEEANGQRELVAEEYSILTTLALATSGH